MPCAASPKTAPSHSPPSFRFALGIGASLSIFTVADCLLLRPMPFREPGRLVMVWEHNNKGRGSQFNSISPGNYRDWKAQNNVFESMAIFGDGRGALIDGARVEELETRFASADLLPLLGVQPYRGRFFTAQEDLPSGPNVLVISYRVWQSWFAGEDSVIGRTVKLRAQPYVIIGVLPPNFYFLNRQIDLWEPVGYDPARDYRATSGRAPSAVARLKPGVTFQQAQTEMTGIARRLELAYPVFDANWTVLLEPLRDSMVRRVKTSIEILLGAVGLLLAVACANVANLLLARYTSRKREIAVRIAIGAGRGRVIRQLITESVVLSLAGGGLGLLFARFAVRGLVALAPQDIARSSEVAVDFRVAWFALALSVLTGVLFGIAPALAASGARMIQGLREASRSSLGGGVRLRSILVSGEVALSLILLAGAGLLFRTLTGLESVNPGLNPTGVVTFRFSLPNARYPESRSKTQFFERALDEIHRLPGVTAASAVSFLPFDGLGAATNLTIAGRPKPAPGEGPGAAVDTVMPDYFRATGIPIVRGRDFTAADNSPDTPYRFLVNETFVRRYFADENPLGKQISVAMDGTNPFGEIIGVVGDTKGGALDKDPEPTVYYVHAHLSYNSMAFLVRTAADPMTLTEPVRRIVRQMDSALPVTQIRTMDSIVRETFSRQRFSALLLIAFSAVSLLLAAVGVYGVLAYAVTGRTREIGVRMALGAEPGAIASLIVANAAAVVLPGMAVGLAGALALTGLLRSMLFGVKPHDALTLIVACVALGFVALAAAYIPARRAARLTPLDALRVE